MKKTSFSLPLIAVLLVGAGYLLIRTGDAAVEISQAQAAIEAARAAQSAAEAAQIASQGLSIVSTIQALILFTIVGAVIGLVATVIYLLWDRRARNVQLNDILAASRKRRWMPGPNADYRELDPIPSAPKLSSGDITQQLVQVLLLQQLGQLTGSQPAKSSLQLPAGNANEVDGDDDLW